MGNYWSRKEIHFEEPITTDLVNSREPIWIVSKNNAVVGQFKSKEVAEDFIEDIFEDIESIYAGDGSIDIRTVQEGDNFTTTNVYLRTYNFLPNASIERLLITIDLEYTSTFFKGKQRSRSGSI